MPKVILSEEIGKEFAKIQARAEKGDGEAKYLLKIIDKGIAKLATNVEVGKKIQKYLWPVEYTRKYGITNLWKLNLDSYWRMIYTIRGTNIEIIAFVLDLLSHKKYDKKFGYKSR
jgi:hypothetical protein